MIHFKRYSRGRSSLGRTFDWQSKGRGFESPRLHLVARAAAVKIE
jgi:hypothetical protein